jgi:D-sedoheptulose 7-phosphate isomerase
MISSSLLRSVEQHREALDKSFGPKQIQVVEEITRQILKTLKAGNKIMLCGNGGSAADSQHIAAEFIARFKRDRTSLPAIALTTDTSILTATANDYDFEQVFSRQVEGLGRPGDLLIAISTSGKSKNILHAVRKAKAQQIYTIGLSGGNGGTLKDLVDVCCVVQATETSRIQEMHILILHAVSEVVEEVLFT